ncbi:MAG: hypothetical protein RRA35_12985 [Desulfomonilia bacterium]|nr:hypothetical protein [Desulfomonilia bacterium]
MSRRIRFRSMVCVALILGLLVLCFGCERKQKEIPPGLYAVEYTLHAEKNEILISNVVRYTPNHEFEALHLVNREPVKKVRGKYRIEKDTLYSFEKTSSLFESEWSDWTDWTPEEPSSVQVRKISMSGYEYYLAFSNDAERTRYAQLGLTEGWNTYRRISE